MIARLLLGVLLTIAFVPAVHETDFERLLRLARIADEMHDAADDQWAEAAPQTQAELEQYALAIISQFAEEGISEGILPNSVGFAEYGIPMRSAVAGRYALRAKDVTLNARFVLDPGWRHKNYLGTLVHELVHAQGYYNEAQTEVLTGETLAALAAQGYPGVWSEFWDLVRRDAMSAAYYIAYFDGELIHTTTDAERITPCNPCDEPTPDPVLMAQWEQARADIFTDEERRAYDKRLRFWLNNGLDYEAVLRAYVVRPLTVLLDAACLDDPIVGERFERWMGPSPNRGYRPGIGPVGPHRVDDFAALLTEAGYC